MIGFGNYRQTARVVDLKSEDAAQTTTLAPTLLALTVSGLSAEDLLRRLEPKRLK
jgi:hypothetical protein